MTIKTIALGLASAGALAAGSAHAKWIPELPHMLDRCVENVTAAYPGTVMGSDSGDSSLDTHGARLSAQ